MSYEEAVEAYARWMADGMPPADATDFSLDYDPGGGGCDTCGYGGEASIAVRYKHDGRSYTIELGSDFARIIRDLVTIASGVPIEELQVSE